MENKLESKDIEMDVMKAEMKRMAARMSALEKKVESFDLPGAVAEAVRELPSEMASAYQASWNTPDATITYDIFISSAY